MSEGCAQFLGAQPIPFRDGKAIPPERPMVSMLINAEGATGRVWYFWKIDPDAFRQS